MRARPLAGNRWRGSTNALQGCSPFARHLNPPRVHGARLLGRWPPQRESTHGIASVCEEDETDPAPIIDAGVHRTHCRVAVRSRSTYTLSAYTALDISGGVSLTGNQPSTTRADVNNASPTLLQ